MICLFLPFMYASIFFANTTIMKQGIKQRPDSGLLCAGTELKNTRENRWICWEYCVQNQSNQKTKAGKWTKIGWFNFHHFLSSSENLGFHFVVALSFKKQCAPRFSQVVPRRANLSWGAYLLPARTCFYLRTTLFKNTNGRETNLQNCFGFITLCLVLAGNLKLVGRKISLPRPADIFDRVVYYCTIQKKCPNLTIFLTNQKKSSFAIVLWVHNLWCWRSR